MCINEIPFIADSEHISNGCVYVCMCVDIDDILYSMLVVTSESHSVTKMVLNKSKKILVL